MDTDVSFSGLAPFSLKDAPALIERVFPAQKIGIESQKERKAGAGQTLTALGSYWKGRKPLVLVRATVLASLLPATDDPEADLEVFDLLMRMDAEGMWRRNPKVTADHIWASAALPEGEKREHIEPPNETGSGPAAWLRIDLSVFDQELIAAREAATARIKLAEATTGGREARLAAIDLAKAANLAAQQGIQKRRTAERERIQQVRKSLQRRALAAMSFARQVGICDRVEQLEDLIDDASPFYEDIWDRVNGHLGTAARTLPDLIRQLGFARFGQAPVIGDPFCGGGSIPFEAARVGCDVVASDLNPVAAMLTWGALNIVGTDSTSRARIAKEQNRVAESVDAEITRLGIEHDKNGNRAKSYLYCLEVVDPQTGWRVPMAPSWVISVSRRCVGKLIPDYSSKRFAIQVKTGASEDEMAEAALGTVRSNHLVYRVGCAAGNEEREYRTPIALLRGDGRGVKQATGCRANGLRLWEAQDIIPREPRWVRNSEPVMVGAAPGAWIGGDIWLERLYCIQWMNGADLLAGKTRPETWFAAPDAEDLEREAKVTAYVQDHLHDWQARGLVPDMRIEPGEKTDEPIRTRGWTHWHHLFTPRALLTMSSVVRAATSSLEHPMFFPAITECADWQSRLCRWETSAPRATGGAMDGPHSTFYNQAINTFMNYCLPSSFGLMPVMKEVRHSTYSGARAALHVHPASAIADVATTWIFDPPYADAVHYHEITEFFIAWLRKNPPAPFDGWTWDSRRPLAIQGKGEKFRSDMVAAFRAMAAFMPENGIQICMFTHKDAAVWADMAGIVWAAGLRVTAAWYVATETTSELKKGGYVQGTVLLVLRKRAAEDYGYRSDIVPEVRARVGRQVDVLTGLNEVTKGNGRDENLFSDADIQMAGYAAALEVLTNYTHIDGVDMTREALRPREPRRRGQAPEVEIVEEMIALAVQTANEKMVPEGVPDSMWERLSPTERFYLKMTAAEAAWPAGASGGKLDDYQNFAKAYRAEGWEDLMADRTPNRARLKLASEFRGAFLQGHAFSSGSLRPTLYAVMGLARDAAAEIDAETSGAQALHGLRDHFGDGEWLRARDNVRTLATWLGRTWERRNPREGSAARVLTSLIAAERL